MTLKKNICHTMSTKFDNNEVFITLFICGYHIGQLKA